MILFPCPRCDKRLAIRDEMAGRLAVCPQCKSRVRVPEPDAAKDEAVERAEGIATQPGPADRAAPVRRPQPPHEPVEEEVEELDEVEESDDFEVEMEVVTRPRRRIDRDEDDELPRRKARKRRKKVRMAGESWWRYWLGGLQPFDKIVAGTVAVALVLALLGVLFPPFALLAVLAAVVLSVGGHLLLIRAAFEEGAGVGCAFLIVPFFPLYFIIVHFDQSKRGLLFMLCALVLIVIAASCGGVGAALWHAMLPSAKLPW